jgi:hypothetical protein
VQPLGPAAHPWGRAFRTLLRISPVTAAGGVLGVPWSIMYHDEKKKKKKQEEEEEGADNNKNKNNNHHNNKYDSNTNQ